eukprot:TRINITY_DN2020_c0_g1_i9.p1 TRINITY_DN2020_c0_g1~~TRINITY_DN2020_c0_g1_i9.p1  ORF type:complete len:258 (+),score=47.11 TRINITY_DN2020_c0_g1_i9:745-1518(+)
MPPVCNRLLYNEQLNHMIVGGPNTRKDYHLEEGEELFWQLEGSMVIKTLQQGKHRDIEVKEGHMFLLPYNIPHSPQRFENTLGIVVERRRAEDEIDGMLWFQENSNDTLYEDYFHCVNLGLQIKDAIAKFNLHPSSRTGKPVLTDGSVREPKDRPVQIDTETYTGEAINYQKWIDEHAKELEEGPTVLSAVKEFAIVIYKGTKPSTFKTRPTETYVHQTHGECTLTIEGVKGETMHQGQVTKVPPNTPFSIQVHFIC